jgi:hypothetical protein
MASRAGVNWNASPGDAELLRGRHDLFLQLGMESY